MSSLRVEALRGGRFHSILPRFGASLQSIRELGLVLWESVIGVMPNTQERMDGRQVVRVLNHAPVHMRYPIWDVHQRRQPKYSSNGEKESVKPPARCTIESAAENAGPERHQG